MASDSVALVKCMIDVKNCLREAIDVIGGFGKLKSPVIVKPNICDPKDVTGFCNSNVDIVEALIQLVLDEDAKLAIRLVESDSHAKYINKAFVKFGYKDLEMKFKDQGFDVSLVNLSDSPKMKVVFDGDYFKDPELPEILTDYGYFISLAIAKTHLLTLITGVTKNLFGLLPRRDQMFYHPQINEVVVDLTRFIKPDLNIIDGRVGLEGCIKGRLIRLNRLLAGRKPVSVDATMARIMGFDAEVINHLVEASKHDLGTIKPKILGESIESSTKKFKKPLNLRASALTSSKLDRIIYVPYCL
jgi:uncharacterized protein (DUF362 family)